MRELENLREMYLAEIRKINKKGELTPQDSDAAKHALEALAKIDELCEKEECDKGYSEGFRRAYSEGMNKGYSEGRYNMMPTMPDMYSYNYSGYRGQSRDSMGRYSRSDTAEHMIRTLEGMLDEAPSDRHRDVITECIQKLRNY